MTQAGDRTQSVRFLKKDLDVWVFDAITTSRRGEVLADTDF